MKKTGKVLAVILGVLFPLCGCGRESRGLTVYVVRSEALYRNGLESEMAAGGIRGELAGWRREQLKEEIDAVEKLLSDHGLVRTEQEVYLIGQDWEAGAKTTSESMLTLGLPEGGYRLEWAVEPCCLRDFTSGSARAGEEVISLCWKEPVFRNGSYWYDMKPPLTDVVLYSSKELTDLAAVAVYDSVKQ